jgi:ABC-type sugar transport system ATPase subunit
VPGEPALEVRDLHVAYGGRAVLHGVTLQVAAGRVLALLGPSGSGKSTLLHVVAGFVEPGAGLVRVAGTTVAGNGRRVPPERRDVALVFQNNALWPHLPALDVVAYPVRRRGVGRAAAREEARAVLDRLGIGRLADRRPAELSGGEQQRVGLGRALARRASLYLFDEPTAHLDTPLRTVFLDELVARQRETGAAAVYATHDADEALGIADEVALLRDGRLVQVGPPREVYEQPVDLAAARLTGPASVVDDPCTGRRVLVRPDWTAFGGPLEGRVRAVRFRGPHSDVVVDSPHGTVVVRTAGACPHGAGDEVRWTLTRSWPLPSAEDAGDR